MFTRSEIITTKQEIERMRDEQMKEIISPFYLQAGLIIMPQMDVHVYNSSIEFYQIFKTDYSQHTFNNYIVDVRPLYCTLVLQSSWISDNRDHYTYTHFLKVMNQFGDKIASIKCRTEEIPYEPYSIEIMRYIHRNERVDVLKSALPHIILSGE